MKNKRLFAVVFLATMAFSLCSAQKSEWKGELGASFEFKNQEFWRGVQLTDNLTYLPSLYYEIGNWSFATYGIFDRANTYKEIDYEITYSIGNFTIGAIDYYAPEMTAPWNETFNFKKDETSHFLDLSVEYAPEAFPFRAMISTCPFGCDFDEDGKFCWSTYGEIGSTQSLPFGFELTETIGAALNRSTYTDYEAKGIRFTSISAELSKSFEFAGMELPLNLGCIWNPYIKDVFFTISFGVAL